MAREDILKEAIADAEKVRKVAFENAKMALEEAFTPRLQQMISAKIKEEIGDEDEEDELVEAEETNDDELDTAEEIESTDAPEGEETVDITIGDRDAVEEPVVVNTDEETGDTTVDIAPEPGEEVNVAVDGEEIALEPEGGEELEGEESIGLEGEDEEIDLDSLEDDSEMEEDIDINIDLEDETEGQVDDIGLEDDEEIGLDLEDEDDDELEEVAVIKNELTETKSQLNKAYEVVEILRGKINEINLLNSKLLYSNKIFRSYALNNDAKTKIIESIDRAKSVREAKLIYMTLTESLASKTEKKVGSKTVQTITEGMGSKKIASTKPSAKIINENVDPYEQIRLRNQKLAGII